MKKALITGVTGQDGSYLAELLIRLGYGVHGVTRGGAPGSLMQIEHLLNDPLRRYQGLRIHKCDIRDFSKLRTLIQEIRPDEIYNLAAQSHILTSHKKPQQTHAVNARAAEALFEIVRDVSPKTRVYQASSSEMFGNSPGPQSEESAFSPQTPYGISKVQAHQAGSLYREKHGLFVSSGILFNHESPRRSELFVTRKITKTAALIHAGLMDTLELGDLDARRDWGYAPDYVFAMWKMLQIDTPGNFVVSTGESNSVKTFVKKAFEYFNMNWEEHTSPNPLLLRPTSVSAGQGDSSRARAPTVNFPSLVSLMCEAELNKLDSKWIDSPQSTLWPSF